MGEVPPERWAVDRSSAGAASAALRFGGFLVALECFDHAHFAVPAHEAGGMDPQQRMLLEECYGSCHAAGRDRRALHNTPTGVAVGYQGRDFFELKTLARPLLDLGPNGSVRRRASILGPLGCHPTHTPCLALALAHPERPL